MQGEGGGGVEPFEGFQIILSFLSMTCHFIQHEFDVYKYE
jgi:hypothetical protein